MEPKTDLDALDAELREARKRVAELEAEIEVRDNSANETLRILRDVMPNGGFHSEMEAATAAAKEIEALREQVESQRDLIIHWQEVVREVALRLGCGVLLSDIVNALDARDRRMKLIGAAEELERSAKTLREDLAGMNPPEFASRGKVAPGYCECLQDVADGMEERAAKLRQEAEDATR